MSYLRNIDPKPVASRGERKGIEAEFTGGIAEGASLRTPIGLRRIELVRPGDLIVTRDSGLQPVKAMLVRKIRPARSARGAAPIRFPARALGPMLPQQDVLMDPEQKLLIPGYLLCVGEQHSACLVRAGDLTNFSDEIRPDRSKDTLRLYMPVFERQEAVCSNGLPAASFLAGGPEMARLGEEAREALIEAIPGLQGLGARHKPLPYPEISAEQCIARSA